MAIIQLKKVLSMNPKMVQGHQLLGLLYLEEGNYEQAAKALEKAHAIDTNNTTTLRYMKELDDRAKASGTTLKDKKIKRRFPIRVETIRSSVRFLILRRAVPVLRY